MDRLDTEGSVRENSQFDLDKLNTVRESLHRIRRRRPKPSYRLAPIGTHRVTIGIPDSPPKKTKHVKSYPGF